MSGAWIDTLYVILAISVGGILGGYLGVIVGAWVADKIHGGKP